MERIRLFFACWLRSALLNRNYCLLCYACPFVRATCTPVRCWHQQERSCAKINTFLFLSPPKPHSSAWSSTHTRWYGSPYNKHLDACQTPTWVGVTLFQRFQRCNNHPWCGGLWLIRDRIQHQSKDRKQKQFRISKTYLHYYYGPLSTPRIATKILILFTFALYIYYMLQKAKLQRYPTSANRGYPEDQNGANLELHLNPFSRKKLCSPSLNAWATSFRVIGFVQWPEKNVLALNKWCTFFIYSPNTVPNIELNTQTKFINANFTIIIRRVHQRATSQWSWIVFRKSSGTASTAWQTKKGSSDSARERTDRVKEREWFYFCFAKKSTRCFQTGLMGQHDSHSFKSFTKLKALFSFYSLKGYIMASLSSPFRHGRRHWFPAFFRLFWVSAIWLVMLVPTGLGLLCMRSVVVSSHFLWWNELAVSGTKRCK